MTKRARKADATTKQAGLKAGAMRSATRRTTSRSVAGARKKAKSKRSASKLEPSPRPSTSASAKSIDAQLAVAWAWGPRTEEDRVLAERFPLALSELQVPPDKVRTPLGQRGVECGAGWRPLLVRLLEQLESEIAGMMPHEQADTRISQIKEKFGGLRVYMRGTVTPTMEQAIGAAVEEAANTCEACGAPARMTRAETGTWGTRCEHHTLGSTREK
jgi:hypothetical protein